MIEEQRLGRAWWRGLAGLMVLLTAPVVALMADDTPSPPASEVPAPSISPAGEEASTSLLPALPLPSDQPVDFLTEVYPILQNRCLSCHGPERVEGALRLDRREFAVKGGHTGSPILGRDSNAIWLRVKSRDDAIRMPKGEAPLPDKDLDVLRRWVSQETPWVDPPQLQPRVKSRYEITWESLQPWHPNDWSNARYTRVTWWAYRFGPAVLAMLVWIGLSSRTRWWVRTEHPRVQPPRGWLWRKLAAIPWSVPLATCLGLCVVGLAMFVQEQGRMADQDIQSLRNEVANLHRQQDPLASIDPERPRPVKPRHPPRLGGEYYRGNDERNVALFNSGFYRTCDMRVWLCREDGTILAWGDEVDPSRCFVRFEIEQSPGATDALFTTEIMEATYLSSLPPSAPIRDPATQIAVFQPDGEKRWIARIPLDLSEATESARNGVLYLCRGKPPGAGEKCQDPHYAAEYSLRLSAGRLTADSELWLGYIFRTSMVHVVPPGKIGEEEWFSFRPIPEIVGPQTTQDPRLLGIEDHRPGDPAPTEPP